MVILNKNEQPVNLDMNRYDETVPKKFSAREVISGQKLAIRENIQVPALTAMILEINKAALLVGGTGLYRRWGANSRSKHFGLTMSPTCCATLLAPGKRTELDLTLV